MFETTNQPYVVTLGVYQETSMGFVLDFSAMYFWLYSTS